ncbi:MULTISPECIES: DUF4118 domain-containing protein [Anaerotruncus]|uniref:DUF4118 domain-containing protein n=1 Tax=Anaerotruncus TaxID=244127 RepID=UPI0008312628|nr:MULTISPECIES: DUF4118 domain-containing protein [Anaerotruncus]RGX57045.1 sensor histidine kinase [Anaerotruncus sp. AF02-27]
MKKQPIWVSLLQLFLILTGATLISCLFSHFGVQQENILMVYLTGVVLVIILTRGYLWGLVASLLGVFTCNFLFTDPIYTLRVSDKDYMITFAIFLAVCLIVGTLTLRLQREVRLSSENEKLARCLYEISSGYLNLSTRGEIVRHTQESMRRLLPNRCTIHLDEPEPQNDHEFPEKREYLPIKSGARVFGTVEVDCSGGSLDARGQMAVGTIISQMALALERELLTTEKEHARLEVEKEKLRSNLLRSISHDLRTPLTGIAGSASFMINSFDSLDKGTILGFLGDIVNDAGWLNNLVENLLNMTRIQDGKLVIKKNNEVVDDILTEAYNRISHFLGGRSVEMTMPDEVLLVPMDGKLIIGVLTNLLDNAAKHTREGSRILVSVTRLPEGKARFEVRDNGGGIKPELLGHIFESFVGSQTDQSDSHRGIGLGLSICQSIVEAHGGVIRGFNNNEGGATFQFDLPLQAAAKE